MTTANDYSTVCSGNLAPVRPEIGPQGIVEGTDSCVLQSPLAELGYPIDSAGSFGSKTDVAVRQLRFDRGLAVDGAFGHDTRQLP